MLQDQKNMLFSSTTITSGTAVGIVSYTGMSTAIGSVHKEVMAAKEDEEDTPLKQKLDNFGDLLAKVIFVICFLVWAMNFNKFFDAIHGSAFKGCIYYFKIAVALAVAAIPEGLPAVITTCLALGTRKMAANNCIVRRLNSVETLGCTSTICSDKTGTLTKNEMCAVQFGIIGKGIKDILTYNVEEKSYSPEGKVLDGFSNETWHLSDSFKHLAAVCALNNRSRIIYADGQFKMQGEPTEAALKVLAEKLGNYADHVTRNNAHVAPMHFADELLKATNNVATLDFSSERKSMSTIISGYNGNKGNTVLLKGAYERVLRKCDNILTSHGQTVDLSESDKTDLLASITAVSSKGYRVLGIAIGLDGGNMKDITKENANDLLVDTSKYDHLESGLSFVGYVCIKDPVRPEVKQSI